MLTQGGEGWEDRKMDKKTGTGEVSRQEEGVGKKGVRLGMEEDIQGGEEEKVGVALGMEAKGGPGLPPAAAFQGIPADRRWQ